MLERKRIIESEIIMEKSDDQIERHVLYSLFYDYVIYISLCSISDYQRGQIALT